MKIDDFDSNKVKHVDAMQSVVTAFDSIEDAILAENMLHQDTVDSGIFAMCSKKGLVFDSQKDLKRKLCKIAQFRAVKPLVDKIYPLVFDRFDIVVNYPIWFSRMLDGERPQFIVMETSVKNKKVWLLIDYVDWNNYWSDRFNGDEIDVGDLPF